VGACIRRVGAAGGDERHPRLGHHRHVWKIWGIHSAVRVFATMPVRNVYSWNAIIGGNMRSRSLDGNRAEIEMFG
jgi:hypothetical protein